MKSFNCKLLSDLAVQWSPERKSRREEFIPFGKSLRARLLKRSKALWLNEKPMVLTRAFATKPSTSMANRTWEVCKPWRSPVEGFQLKKRFCKFLMESVFRWFVSWEKFREIQTEKQVPSVPSWRPWIPVDVWPGILHPIWMIQTRKHTSFEKSTN